MSTLFLAFPSVVQSLLLLLLCYRPIAGVPAVASIPSLLLMVAGVHIRNEHKRSV